jgi:DNA-binding Lrp family transcriptional regulator
MYKLDKLYKKLIYELDLDASLSNSQIAKKIGTSKQVVGYRIKNLIDKQIIRKFYPIYNLERLGHLGQKVYFQMQGLDLETEKKIISYFQKHEKVIWFGIYEGRFDFVISIYGKNRLEFDKTLSQILKHLGKYVLDFEIAYYLGVLAMKKDYLSNKIHSEKFSFFGSEEDILQLDKKDEMILKELSSNAREQIVKIATKLNISSDAVISRIKKLKEKGVIQGSRIMLNKKELGINEFKLLIKLKNYDEAIHNKLISFCKANPNVVAYIKTIGPWNLELDIEIFGLEKFHSLIRNMKTQFKDSIKSIETLIMYDEFKYNFFPFSK